MWAWGFPASDRRDMVKGNRWEDHYTRRARDEKWLARSVYKLQEIDKKFKLIRRGDHILDLGCYPGSWSQYGIKIVGLEGDVVGVDLHAPERLVFSNFRFIRADILKLDPDWLSQEIGGRDIVLSDLAPQTSGIKMVDTARSFELTEKAFHIALRVLKKQGHFLGKVFEGEDLKNLKRVFSEHFDPVRLIRPSAVRKGSREVYLLGENFS